MISDPLALSFGCSGSKFLLRPSDLQIIKNRRLRLSLIIASGRYVKNRCKKAKKACNPAFGYVIVIKLIRAVLWIEIAMNVYEGRRNIQ